MFLGAPLFGRFALAGDHHVFHTEVGELVVDLGFTVAAVGGDRPGCLSGPLLYPLHGRGQLRRVGRIALLHSAIQHDPIVVVDDGRRVPELDGAPEAAFGDRAGIGVVQADSSSRPIRSMSGHLLPGLCHDLPRRLEQLGHVVDRAGQPPAPPPRGGVVNAAFAQLVSLRLGPAQRLFGVGQQPLGLAGSGGGQLGWLASDPAHGGLRLVAAGRRAGAQLGGDRVGPLAGCP